MQEIINKLSKELGYTYEEIEEVYKSYWLFIREKIKALPLKKVTNEEEFSKLKTNFNIPGLGKLSCNYQRWQQVKKRLEHLKKNYNVKHKKDSSTI